MPTSGMAKTRRQEEDDCFIRKVSLRSIHKCGSYLPSLPSITRGNHRSLDGPSKLPPSFFSQLSPFLEVGIHLRSLTSGGASSVCIRVYWPLFAVGFS